MALPNFPKVTAPQPTSIGDIYLYVKTNTAGNIQVNFKIEILDETNATLFWKDGDLWQYLNQARRDALTNFMAWLRTKAAEFLTG